MTAAASLLKLQLNDGWRVTRRVPRSAIGTGGAFSHSYFAERDGDIAFVKAFDFSNAFDPGADTLSILGLLTASFEHEKDVLEHCKSRRFDNVAIAIGHGHVSVPGLSQMEGRVYYLLFERADGDIRCQMDSANASDSVWCMRALRHVTLGLHQVHKEMIAHQDVKPSNVLIYPDGNFKVADFGRSSRRGHTVWYDERDFPGDHTYAPPELLYGFVNQDFIPRRIGTDLYMLGNLAAFLFTGTNVTASVIARLDNQHRPQAWAGTYKDILPYLQESFSRYLDDLREMLTDDVRDDISSLVRELCNPDLSLRGHPRVVGRPNQYSLERHLSIITRYSAALEIKTKLSKAS